MEMKKYAYPHRVSIVRENTDRYPTVCCSRDFRSIADKLLNDAATERFLMFFLNSKNVVEDYTEVSVGSMNVSVVHPRDAFRAAVIYGANAVVLAHNHPSGNPTPSRDDRECTRRMVQAGKILGIRVLDHIVVGYDKYYSFADAGQLDDIDDDNYELKALSA
jgi:DNA repair protein RadC